MQSDSTHTNESFGKLYNSSDFLGKILHNLTSCILLLNKDLELQAYNNTIKTIFPFSKDRELLYQKCGDVIGCAYNIDEQIECGRTSYCNSCELRVATLKSYVNSIPITKEKFTRPFYNKNMELEQKTLQYSTRLFMYDHEKYIILILDELSCE